MEEAAEETPEPVESVTDTVNEAVESAVDAAESAVEDAAEAAQDAVEDAVDQATEALKDATDGVDGEAALSDVLTVDGFDFDKAIEMIDGSDLGAVQKTTLKAGLEQARDNPELLSQLLEQVRGAMGQ